MTRLDFVPVPHSGGTLRRADTPEHMYVIAGTSVSGWLLKIYPQSHLASDSAAFSTSDRLICRPRTLSESKAIAEAHARRGVLR